jgi:pimeloyl-ACP methyl ester carboxylesterase
MIGHATTAQSHPDGSQTIAPRGAQDSGPCEGITPFFPDWVVPLQSEGTGRPVFVFPSADNEPVAILIEAEIADRVGREHPFWAFARDNSQLDLVRERGVAAVVAEYIAQMRVIQGKGPFLLTGHCIGGYAAWETARQLLDAGEEIAGILFYEVPIRPDFATVLPGHPPVHDTRNIMRLAHYYRPLALPIDLTYIMTETWHGLSLWAPWQEVVLGTFETLVLPDISLGTEEFIARRRAMLAHQVREWIDKSEARLRGTSAPN